MRLSQKYLRPPLVSRWRPALIFFLPCFKDKATWSLLDVYDILLIHIIHIHTYIKYIYIIHNKIYLHALQRDWRVM